MTADGTRRAAPPARQVPQFYRWLGGRKQANGILYSLVLTVVYVWKVAPASFETYSVLLGLGLGVTGALHVWEDTAKAKLAGQGQ